MQNIEVEFEECGSVVTVPAAIPPDGSMLRHHVAVDTAMMMAEAIHEASCGICKAQQQDDENHDDTNDDQDGI